MVRSGFTRTARRARCGQVTPALGLLALVAACDSEPRELRIARPVGHWKAAGYTEMIPPLRLPGYRSRRDRTEVWLKLAKGGVIQTRYDENQGRHLLEYPPGTDAVRVEYRAWGKDRNAWRWGVADVRGTRIEKDGQRFYALRPVENRPEASLAGYEWPREDAEAARKASDRLVEKVAQLASDARRASAVAKAERTNQCASCHVMARRRNQRPREFGLVNRGTDASGFVLIQTVLEGRAPLETYFPVEHNLTDPFIRFVCDGGAAAARAPGKLPTCPEDRVPTGVLDVGRALGAGDPRVRRLCEARRYLRDHLDETGRKVFRRSFDECGL